jgi:hypothetical protein
MRQRAKFAKRIGARPKVRLDAVQGPGERRPCSAYATVIRYNTLMATGMGEPAICDFRYGE